MKQVLRWDKVEPDETAEEGRYFTEPTKVANESDSSRTKEPETVATANAESTRRRISSSVLTPADLIRKASQVNDTQSDGSNLPQRGWFGCA